MSPTQSHCAAFNLALQQKSAKGQSHVLTSSNISCRTCWVSLQQQWTVWDWAGVWPSCVWHIQPLLNESFLLEPDHCLLYATEFILLHSGIKCCVINLVDLDWILMWAWASGCRLTVKSVSCSARCALDVGFIWRACRNLDGDTSSGHPVPVELTSLCAANTVWQQDCPAGRWNCLRSC